MGYLPDTSRFFYLDLNKMVYFCYIDESGTPQIPGNTSHYVLCGISIPVNDWKKCDIAINKIKARYDLTDTEIHTGWIVRSYLEQTRIPGFEHMSRKERRSEVIKQRKAEIFKAKRQNQNLQLTNRHSNSSSQDSSTIWTMSHTDRRKHTDC